MRKLTLSMLLCFILITGVLPAGAQQINFGDVDKTITDLMQMYDVPGVALAIVQNGKVLYTKGYGVRSTGTKAPVTENTLFAIGSVSKSFTALDIAQLVEQGKLDLDTPIIKYLPDFKLSDPDATKTLTLRQVMSHSSGLPRSEDWYFSKATLTRKQIIDDMVKIDLTAQPGRLWQYNNQNFVLAGYLVEQLTGQSWEDYTQKHVFDALGMKTANFDAAQSQKTADYSEPHALNVLKGMQPIPFSNKLGAIAPAGAINASALDMAQYALFQLGDGTFNGQPVVSRKLLDLMHTQQIAISEVDQTASPTAQATLQPTAQPTAAATITPTAAATSIATVSAVPTVPAPALDFRNVGYGLGWFTEDYRGVHLVEHGGNIDGFSANITLIPSTKAGIVLLTNADKTLLIEPTRLRLVELMLGLKPAPDVVAIINKASGYDPAKYRARLEAARTYKADPAELKRYAGDYTSPLGKVTVSAGDNMLRLVIEGTQSADIELVPFEAGNFLSNTPPLAGVLFTFKVDDQGTVTLYQDVGGQPVSIGELRAKGAKAAEYKDPQGRFTATVPDGLIVQQMPNYAVIQSANPAGVFILVAADVTADSLEGVAAKVLKSFDPSFDQKPDATTELKAANGLTWTQFSYKLPSEQTLIFSVVKQKNTSYLIILQGKTDAVKALTPTLNKLIESVTITAK